MERGNTMICFVILHYQAEQETVNCINNIKEKVQSAKKIVVVDNASPNGSGEYLQKRYDSDSEVEIVLLDKNLGFAKGNNRVLEKHLNDFSYSILLNNDTEFVENTAENLIHYLEKNDNVGVVTSSIYYYSDKERLWNAGGRIFCGTRKYYLNKDVQTKLEHGINEMSVDYITGCFLVVKNTVLREHGLITEKFFFGEEDNELCRRMKEKKIILKHL